MIELQHGDSPAEWRAAHRKFKRVRRLWVQLTDPRPINLDGRAYEQRLCPCCRSNIVRPMRVKIVHCGRCGAPEQDPAEVRRLTGYPGRTECWACARARAQTGGLSDAEVKKAISDLMRIE